MSNRDGTFREIGGQAHCDISSFVKGVTSADYDNDGWVDIYISSIDGANRLLRNKGNAGNEIVFEDATEQAGLSKFRGNTFPTWFWDYNNDGWMDIFACDNPVGNPLAMFAAAEKLGIDAGNPDKIFLFENNRNGTFTNKARELGLNKTAFAMGSNFGDINNDGFLDMYLGTGNPNYRSVIPNKMFMNLNGEKFADITTAARVGHLQKGHGVSFADLDNDGDQDIHIEMGGAFPGDAYPNALFLNPNEGLNNWICIQLEGTESNRSAIGTRIIVKCTDEGIKRIICRDVNSGGSFGTSPMRREIGLGKANQIDEIEIRWHGSGKTQVFKNIPANQFIKITEGNPTIAPVKLRTINWILPDKLCVPTL